MKRKPVTTVIEKLKKKGYRVFTEIDDIIAEIEDISPLHSEFGDKPAKKTKKNKKKRENVNIFEENANKFIGEE